MGGASSTSYDVLSATRVEAMKKPSRAGGSKPPKARSMINPAIYILMVIIGTSPPQQRGEFHSYHHCYEAAQSEIASLGPDARWDCVPTYRDSARLR
jgi:hypothetical protein